LFISRDDWPSLLRCAWLHDPAPVPHSQFHMIPAAYKGAKVADKDDDN
jgi:hypothetical protein